MREPASAQSSPCAQNRNALTNQEAGALCTVFHRHVKGEEVVLDFDGFQELALELGLPIASEEVPIQRARFAEINASNRQDGLVDFQEFCAWIDTSDSLDAVALREMQLEDEASVWGGIVRTFTNLTRPLSNVVQPASMAVKVKLKHVMIWFSKKMAAALKTSMQNPARLFRRQAVSPLHEFAAHPAGAVEGLRAELSSHGVRGVTRKAIGPYIFNSFVAMSMFHTYSVARLLARGATYDLTSDSAGDTLTPLVCEAAAGGAAGVIQATLNTPLYNIKLRERQTPSSNHGSRTLVANLFDIFKTKGVFVAFQNYRYVVAQEACSLAAFFASYEYFKERATRFMRKEYDEQGKKDTLAWAIAASAAGVVLVAVGTPFENVLEWHVVRRTETTPKSVVGHFLRDAAHGATCPRIIFRRRSRILFSGLRRKLPFAPLSGLPLLVYETMLHHGITPALHEDD